MARPNLQLDPSTAATIRRAVSRRERAEGNYRSTIIEAIERGAPPAAVAGRALGVSRQALNDYLRRWS